MDMVHRINEGYRTWGALKSVPSNRGFGINAKKCLNEGAIAPTVVRSRGMEYEKCREKKSECYCVEVFEKFGWSVTNG